MNQQRIAKSIFCLVVFPILTACTTNPSKQEIGTVSGAVVGGITGAALTGSTAGAVGGAAAGAYIGHRIGGELERK